MIYLQYLLQGAALLAVYTLILYPPIYELVQYIKRKRTTQ